MSDADISAEGQLDLMGTDLRSGLDDLLKSLETVTKGGGRLAVSGGNLIEREIRMAVGLSDQIRDSVFSSEALDEVRAQPLYGRLRSDGYRVVDLLADVGGITAQGIIRAADGFFAQRSNPPATANPGSDQVTGPSTQTS
jgi:hypothetical protein